LPDYKYFFFIQRFLLPTNLLSDRLIPLRPTKLSWYYVQ